MLADNHETHLRSTMNDCIHTQANQLSFCEASVIQLFFTLEQEDFTDASDDDVSDDDMEEFFTEENLGLCDENIGGDGFVSLACMHVCV
jgi:hypothetical protein